LFEEHVGHEDGASRRIAMGCENQSATFGQPLSSESATATVLVTAIGLVHEAR
jgi:hypothetical protein